ncbi:MAG TPA: POT family MFS transporter [Cytophagaceae bacterium]|jgi:POT family proton-dependent oligopeptide transporter|nr:POT family MFS transporter [Cytophagaceae bacterium]
MAGDLNKSTKTADSKSQMPHGIPYIIGNELAERFSYYGMRTILTVFMTVYLLDSSGKKDVMTEEESKVWYHLFSSANYLLPIMGAVFADALWGKYRTIIALSIVYCLGHLALSMDDTRLGLSLGLTMIAIGSGGIKPCVSALVGDQFNKDSQHLLEKVYNLFYLSINVGATVSTILTPYLLRNYGPSLAFGVPGALMIFATLIFWLGRHRYTTPPPVGFKKYFENFKDKEILKTLSSLLVIYFFMAIFWSLYEQTPSSWVLQASSPLVDKHIDLNLGIFNFQWLRFEIFPEQLQSLNPIFVLLFVPLFSFLLYPLISKVFPLTPLRKMSIGFFVMAFSFVIIAIMEEKIRSGTNVSILWQALAYAVLTAAEVLVYGTGLEFSYTQAPNSMKSFIMGLFLLSISAGNLITAAINYIIQNADGTSKLAGASYYWFFVIMMIITSCIFIFAAKNYKGKAHIQA